MTLSESFAPGHPIDIPIRQSHLVELDYMATHAPLPATANTCVEPRRFTALAIPRPPTCGGRSMSILTPSNRSTTSHVRPSTVSGHLLGTGMGRTRGRFVPRTFEACFAHR